MPRCSTIGLPQTIGIREPGAWVSAKAVRNYCSASTTVVKHDDSKLLRLHPIEGYVDEWMRPTSRGYNFVSDAVQAGVDSIMQSSGELALQRYHRLVLDDLTSRMQESVTLTDYQTPSALYSTTKLRG